MSPAIAANPPVPVNTNSPRTADHCELGQLLQELDPVDHFVDLVGPQDPRLA